MNSNFYRIIVEFLATLLEKVVMRNGALFAGVAAVLFSAYGITEYASSEGAAEYFPFLLNVGVQNVLQIARFIIVALGIVISWRGPSTLPELPDKGPVEKLKPSNR